MNISRYKRLGILGSILILFYGFVEIYKEIVFLDSGTIEFSTYFLQLFFLITGGVIVAIVVKFIANETKIQSIYRDYRTYLILWCIAVTIIMFYQYIMITIGLNENVFYLIIYAIVWIVHLGIIVASAFFLSQSFKKVSRLTKISLFYIIGGLYLGFGVLIFITNLFVFIFSFFVPSIPLIIGQSLWLLVILPIFQIIAFLKIPHTLVLVEQLVDEVDAPKWVQNKLYNGEKIIVKVGRFYATDRRLLNYTNLFDYRFLEYERITNITYKKNVMAIIACIIMLFLSSILFITIVPDMLGHPYKIGDAWVRPFSGYFANPVLAVCTLITACFIVIVCLIDFPFSYYQIENPGFDKAHLRYWRIHRSNLFNKKVHRFIEFIRLKSNQTSKK